MIFERGQGEKELKFSIRIKSRLFCLFQEDINK